MSAQSWQMLSTRVGPNPLDHRWGVILAGGDGKRLLPLTRRIAGDNRPKQFCAIMDGETLLAQTRCRVERMVQPRHTLLVVTETHERFYSDQLNDVPSSSLLVQPCNRGTTPAILYSLVRLRESDPSAIVGFFPSDHHFADDEALIAHVDSAFEAAESSSGRVVLLGIKPSSPEVAYGWIEPGASLTDHRIRRGVRGQPVLGEAQRFSRLRSNGAGLSLEQLLNGRSGRRVSWPNPACASRVTRVVRINPVIIVHGRGARGTGSPLLGHSRQQFFR